MVNFLPGIVNSLYFQEVAVYLFNHSRYKRLHTSESYLATRANYHYYNNLPKRYTNHPSDRAATSSRPREESSETTMSSDPKYIASEHQNRSFQRPCKISRRYIGQTQHLRPPSALRPRAVN